MKKIPDFVYCSLIATGCAGFWGGAFLLLQMPAVAAVIFVLSWWVTFGTMAGVHVAKRGEHDNRL